MSLEAGVLVWMVGSLAGSMLFFGVVVAPQVFRVLPEESAGKFLRAFFPGYYLWGGVVATLAGLAALFIDWVSSLICLLVIVSFAYARQRLMPQINDARDASLRNEAQAEQRFERLHRLSVAINGVQFLLLLIVAARIIWT